MGRFDSLPLLGNFLVSKYDVEFDRWYILIHSCLSGTARSDGGFARPDHPVP